MLILQAESPNSATRHDHKGKCRADPCRESQLQGMRGHPFGFANELLSAGLGVQGMLWSTSPAATEAQMRVLDWLAELVGLPEGFRSTSGTGAR